MSPDPETIDTLVLGAGHAGLAMSRTLQRAGVEHLVLEKDSIGSSWRSRWASFHLNTPSQLNVMPDGEDTGPADAFWSRDAWVQALQRYQARHELPVRCGVEVQRIRRSGDGFEVQTSSGPLQARRVVICTGDQNVPTLPSLRDDMPDDLLQLHTRDYRSAQELPEGGVLVVGSGQSGVQIVEELVEAGRPTWLCTSFVGRAPRRYRGRDITGWVDLLGMADQRPEDVTPQERNARQGMISGTKGGHSLSLHLLAHKGANLLGRVQGIEGGTLQIADDLLRNVAVGDAGAKQLRAGLDAVIAKMGLDAPPAQPDPADAPYEGLESMAAVRTLDLGASDIRTVIWATGFGGNFDFLDPDWLAEDGRPRHQHGVCEVDGLYCLGLAWSQRRISGLIAGAQGDAEALVAHIVQARTETGQASAESVAGKAT